MRNLKKIRLPDYNYRSDGYYFVTIVSRHRDPLFAGNNQQIEKLFRETIGKIEGSSIDTIIIMPNHVHLIVVLEHCRLGLGEIIRRGKAVVSHHLGHPAWQPNYYEHVIRDETALNRIREYIIYNPTLEVLKFDQFYANQGSR